MQNSEQPLSVLVVAPFGRDADLISETLQRADIASEICRDPRSALPRLSNGAGALLVEEEVFDEPLIRDFATALQNQPAWSDAPLIVLTKGRGATSQTSRVMARKREPLGHATLLERPIRPETLISTVQTVLRSRLRQFQVRDALQRLQASEARYRSLISATSSIVWNTDPHGSIVEPLPSWEAYTGQNFQQYRGIGWMDAIYPRDRQAAVATMSTAIALRHSFQLEYRLRRHDGEYRWVATRGVPVFYPDASVKEWVGTCSDIQDRKNSESALRKSERMALAGQMAAGIAHEINNPLEAVTNLIYLIAARAADDETREYAAIAQRELTRVTEISGQTLRFYRKSTTPLQTDVTDLLRSLLQLFQTKFARRNLQLRTRLKDSVKVTAFPNELRQLFANLISNAIDATSPGGSVCVASRAAVDWRNPQHRGVRVTIADVGSGIPESLKRRIFEPFVTSKGDSGTGLGLWVCDDVVTRHGGSIRLKSRTGHNSGTVFSIFLPEDRMPTPQSVDGAQLSDAIA